MTTAQEPEGHRNNLDYLRERYGTGGGTPIPQVPRIAVPNPSPDPEPTPPPRFPDQVNPLTAIREGSGSFAPDPWTVPVEWNDSQRDRNPAPVSPGIHAVIPDPAPTAPRFEDSLLVGSDDYRIRSMRDLPTRGFRRFLAETLRLPVGKSRAEQEYDGLIALMNRSLLGPKVIGVIGGKGGVGKTSCAMCLASTLAENRSKPVCVVTLDYNSSLALRTKTIAHPARGEVSLLDFATDRTIVTPNDVAGCMRNNKHRLSVLGAGLDAVHRDHLTAQQYQQALARLKSNYELIVVDFGNIPSAEAYWAALQSLDAMVLVTSTENDSMQGTKLVEGMAREAGMLDLLDRQTVVLINHRTPAEPKVDIQHFVGRMQSSRRREILDIPWDEHLSESGPVDLDLLSRPVKYQFVRAAALTMTALPT